VTDEMSAIESVEGRLKQMGHQAHIDRNRMWTAKSGIGCMIGGFPDRASGTDGPGHLVRTQGVYGHAHHQKRPMNQSLEDIIKSRYGVSDEDLCGRN
jgi:hypothetical protein